MTRTERIPANPNYIRVLAAFMDYTTICNGAPSEFLAPLALRHAKEGVLLLPGTLYNPEFNSFRIGFGRRNLPDSLDRLEQFVLDSGYVI